MSMDNPIIQSIRDRLYSIAKTNNEDFQIVLIRFTLERLLYRLSLTKYNEQFILKGAFLYYLWGGPNYRPTRDIDFLSFGSNDVFYLEDIFKRIITQTTNGKDGLLFISDSVKGQKTIKSQKIQQHSKIGYCVIS